MPLLRMRDASFANTAARAGPLTLDLEAGRRIALTFSSSQEATIVALMAAGIAKATIGSVLIGDYDPRVQSVHCKRIAGFVPHEPLELDEGDFPRYVAYRAALWNVEATAAQAYARLLCERLEGMHEAFSYPLIGALIAMPPARAFAGMLQARLYVSRRLVAYSCGCAVLVALVAPNGVSAPLFCCSLLGIVLALDQSPGRHRHLDRCEQSAPLFGRELARAKALVPCIAATLATLLFAATQFARGSPDGPATLLVVPPAVIACSLTALSATTRRGATRALYVLLACATMAAAYALEVVANQYLAELAFCVIVSFFALRQYGETLARFDPI
jgi:hypothetical protein